MARLNILRYPDPRLKKHAAVVKSVDERVRKLVRDMAETMYAAPGVGLAATQVDVHQRIIVIDITPTMDDLRVFINPEIVERHGVSTLEEGCLSVPGIYDRVERAERIKLRALDADGALFELEADGLLAVCIQHEIDHLEGKMFVDYLSRMKQARIRTKMLKQERETA
jgi:peptide deformylase